jgi:hypothetical protein
VAEPVGRRRLRGQLGLVALLLATFSIELAAGFVVINNGRDTSALDAVSNVLVASLIIGVARAWELVGDRDTGVLSSIAALTGHERPLGGYAVLDGPGGQADRPDRPDRAGGADGADVADRPGGADGADEGGGQGGGGRSGGGQGGGGQGGGGQGGGGQGGGGQGGGQGGGPPAAG